MPPMASFPALPHIGLDRASCSGVQGLLWPQALFFWLSPSSWMRVRREDRKENDLKKKNERQRRKAHRNKGRERYTGEVWQNATNIILSGSGLLASNLPLLAHLWSEEYWFCPCFVLRPWTGILTSSGLIFKTSMTSCILYFCEK